MAEELKNLIEKIREEGIKAADEKARAIEDEARKRAEEIMGKAKKESQSIIAKSKEDAAKTTAAGRALLDQAARDFLISLRKEINSTLDRVILAEIRGALSGREMADIITALIKECVKGGENSTIITLRKEDAEKVQEALMGGVKEEIVKGITIHPSEDITGGFTIGFDGGKSHYDFTDKALAEYIGSCVYPKLDALLKGATGK